jgi:acyl carrier protein
MIERRDIWRTIRTLVGEVVGRTDLQLTESTLFEEELRLESIQVVEIQVAIEETYDLELDPLAITSSRSLGDLLDYLSQELTLREQGRDVPLNRGRPPREPK